MRIRPPSHRNAHMFLFHVFGRGLNDGERYVIGRYRTLAGAEICPVQTEEVKPESRRKRRRTIASTSEVQKLRPEREESII